MGTFDKYYLYKQQRRELGSSDAWEDVVPSIYSIDGDGTETPQIAEVDSPDCGYVPPVDPIYRWVNMSISQDYYCDECPPSDYTFLWENGTSAIYYSGDSSSTGVTFGVQSLKDGSYINYEVLSVLPDWITDVYKDSGRSTITISWDENQTDTTRFIGILLSQDESNSQLYLSLTIEGAVIQKLKLIYTGSTVYSANCDSNSTLTSSMTRPTGYSQDALREAIVYDCIRTIGVGAFQNYPSLQYVTFPSTLVTLGTSAFLNCYGLSEITVPASVDQIGSYTFANDSGLTNIYFHTGSVLSYIGNNAFSGCTSLESITIPSGVTMIGTEAFYGCTGLTAMTFLSESVPTIGSDVIPENGCTLYVPCNSLENYRNAWPRYASRLEGFGCPEYTFTWGDDTTSKTSSFTWSSTGVTLQLNSTKGAYFQNYSMLSFPSWVTSYSKNSGEGTVQFVWSQNTTSRARIGTIELTQNESLKKVQINVTIEPQESGNDS